MKQIVVVTLAFVVLTSGCTTRFEPFEAEVVIPAVKVKTDTNHAFCPPGQARKGRC